MNPLCLSSDYTEKHKSQQISSTIIRSPTIFKKRTRRYAKQKATALD